jgi:hypothetical protein
MIDSNDYRHIADRQVRLGRRIGWYAFARALKPKVVIETGVDKGLGSCLLTAALIKNGEEGYQGSYYGTDINPKTGYLLSGEYADFGKILYGVSLQSLSDLSSPIDLFIDDSDHSSEYEANECETIANKLSDNAVVLGDKSHSTDKLLQFPINLARNFFSSKRNPLITGIQGRVLVFPLSEKEVRAL